MYKYLNLLALVASFTIVHPIQTGFSDYDNEVDFNPEDRGGGRFLCPSEGFHPDRRNCRIFYRCVDYGGGALVSFKFECGGNTVFSESRGNVCVHPRESDRPECGVTRNEIDSEASGSSGVFSRWTHPPETRPITDTRFVPQKSSLGMRYRAETVHRNLGGGVSCQEEGFMEDPQNCQKFYRCVSQGNGRYQKFEFDCGEGTVWDQNILGCNHPWAVDKPGCGTGSGGAGNGQFSDDGGFPRNPQGGEQSGSLGEDYDGAGEYQGNQGFGNQGFGNQGFGNQGFGNQGFGNQNGGYDSNRPQNGLGFGNPNGSGAQGSTPRPGSTPGQEYLPAQTPQQTPQRPPQQTPQQTPQRPPSRPGQTGQNQYLPPSSTNRPPPPPVTSARPPMITSPQTSPASKPSTARPKPAPVSKPSATYLPSNTNAPAPKPTKAPAGNGPKAPQSNQSGPKPAAKPGSTYLPANQGSPQSGPSNQNQNQAAAQGNNPGSGAGPSQGSGGAGRSGPCQEEGFYPNPNNCRKFYRCVSNPPGFIKYDFDCGPGTAWDQDLLTCNYIHQVASCGGGGSSGAGGPSGGGGPPSGGDQGYPSGPPDASESPESPEESEEQPDQETQPPKESENPEEQTQPSKESDKPSTAPGTEGTTKAEDDSAASGYPESSSPSSPFEDGAAPESDSKGSGKPDDCKSPNKNKGIVCDEPGFYPHPTRCDKFYRCVDNGNGFNVYHFDCGPGTHFDPSINVCNYPESIYPARDCDASGDGGADECPSTTTDASSPPASDKPTTSKDATTMQTTDTQATTESSSDATTSASDMTTSSDMSTDATTPATTMAGDKTDATTTSSDSETTMDSTTTAASDSTATTAASDSTATTAASSEEMTTVKDSDMMESTTAPSATTAASATTPSSDETTMMTKDPSSFGENCPELANLTDEQVVLVCPTGFKRHPKLCNLFYQCTSGGNMEIKILILSCPNGTLFDEAKVQCLPESETMPCMGAMADSRRLSKRAIDTESSIIEVKSDKLCPGEGHYPYRRGCSNAFYKCRRNSRNSLQGYIYKCPRDYVYWPVSRRCERSERIPACSNTTYELKEEIEAWSQRWNIPTEERNLPNKSIYN